jgi:hypothetical protein
MKKMEEMTREEMIQEVMSWEFDYAVDRIDAEKAVDEGIADYEDDPEWYEDYEDAISRHIHEILYPEV